MIHIQHAILTKQQITQVLDLASSSGIKNVYVEYGTSNAKFERSAGSPLEAVSADLQAHAEMYFSSTLDLVLYIRHRYQDTFCIVVPGYPTGCPHGAVEGSADAILAKQEAGANIVLAQHVYEAVTFFEYVAELQQAAVTLPVIPSILLLQNAAATSQANAVCGVRLPPRVAQILSAAGHDEQMYRQAGIRLTVELCKDLLSAGISAIHFLTLNLETVLKSVLTELGLSGPGAAARRKLPWRPSGDEARAGEDVRPIFWANRPASYVERTSAWTNFPCGRWGSRDSRTAAGADRPFTEIPESALVPASAGTPEERRAIWGEAPAAESDIWRVFSSYVEGRVPRLPWCEVALLPETSVIQSALARINQSGYLTINSQPRVNAARSDDATFGWGGPGGYIYQKSYVEFFCPPGHLAALMEACSAGKQPSVTYHAVNAAGQCYTNSRAGKSASGANMEIAWSSVNAVTWGVFPDKEILQPTVMDPEAFRGAWRAEAFALWIVQWAVVYDEDSAAADLLHTIHDSYFLVNMVDNDFIGGDLFSVFENALKILAEPGKKDRDPGAVYSALVASSLLSVTPPLGARSGSASSLSALAMHPPLR